MDKMLTRLEAMNARYEEISNMLINSPASLDARSYGKLSKEQASLQATVDAYHQLKDVMDKIEENKLLLSDHELREMAEMELEDLNQQKQRIIDHLEVLLIEKDPNDESWMKK